MLSLKIPLLVTSWCELELPAWATTRNISITLSYVEGGGIELLFLSGLLCFSKRRVADNPLPLCHLLLFMMYYLLVTNFVEIYCRFDMLWSGNAPRGRDR